MENTPWNGWVSCAGIVCMVLCLCGGNAWAEGGMHGDGLILVAQNSVPRSTFQGPGDSGNREAAPVPEESPAEYGESPSGGDCPKIDSVLDMYPNSRPVDDPSLPKGLRLYHNDGSCEIDFHLGEYDGWYTVMEKPGLFNMLENANVHAFFMEMLGSLGIDGDLFVKLLNKANENAKVGFFDLGVVIVEDVERSSLYSLTFSDEQGNMPWKELYNFAWYALTEESVEMGCLDKISMDSFYSNMSLLSEDWAPKGSKVQHYYEHGLCGGQTDLYDATTKERGQTLDQEFVFDYIRDNEIQEYSKISSSLDVEEIVYYKSGYIAVVYDEDGLLSVLVFPAKEDFWERYEVRE